jgi:hypothetical protein
MKDRHHQTFAMVALRRGSMPVSEAMSAMAGQDFRLTTLSVWQLRPARVALWRPGGRDRGPSVVSCDQM